MTEAIKHTRQFHLYYYSEVSAVIDAGVEERAGKKWVVVEANHSSRGISISDWFHFCDKTVGGDSLVEEVCVDGDVRESTLIALHKMAEALWPGPKFWFEDSGSGVGPQHDDDGKMYEHFRQDFLFAFLTGVVAPQKLSHQSVPEEYWIEDFKSENFEDRNF